MNLNSVLESRKKQKAGTLSGGEQQMLAIGRVLMLSEGQVIHPIDYRDIITEYNHPDKISNSIEKFVKAIVDRQFTRAATKDEMVPEGLLERIDLGDIAAENEIRTLNRYFVNTPQYQQTKKGHARLVVGRKGTGKTAIFYMVRRNISSYKEGFIIDLKPDGHHFTKLRETVLEHMTEGVRLHTLTCFWNYLLLLEMAHKIIERDVSHYYKDPEAIKEYESLCEVYEKHCYNNRRGFF